MSEGLPDTPGALLRTLTQRLETQRAMAAGNDFDGLGELMGECDVLLSQLAESGVISPQYAEELACIRDLYSQLGLMLAQKRDELAGELSHGQLGRHTLQAYRRAGF